MTTRDERIAALVAEGDEKRAALKAVTFEILDEVERRRSQWKAASYLAMGAAAIGTVAYKLFGRTSFSARMGRTASVVSIIVGLFRAFQKVHRFF
jgi:hypothetical protein